MMSVGGQTRFVNTKTSSGIGKKEEEGGQKSFFLCLIFGFLLVHKVGNLVTSISALIQPISQDSVLTMRFILEAKNDQTRLFCHCSRIWGVGLVRTRIIK